MTGDVGIRSAKTYARRIRCVRNMIGPINVGIYWQLKFVLLQSWWML